jgi:hypothetical protein
MIQHSLDGDLNWIKDQRQFMVSFLKLLKLLQQKEVQRQFKIFSGWKYQHFNH